MLVLTVGLLKMSLLDISAIALNSYNAAVLFPSLFNDFNGRLVEMYQSPMY